MKKVIFVILLTASVFSYSSPCEKVMKVGQFTCFHSRLKGQFALQSTDVGKRLEAVRLLARTGKPSALKQALRDEHAGVRSLAIKLLGEMGEPALPILKKTLREKHLYVRSDVVKALVTIGEPALPLLETFLENTEDILIRLRVVRELSRMSESARPLLRKALRDTDTDVRSLAVVGLARMSTSFLLRDVFENEDTGVHVHLRAVEELAKIGEPALYILEKVLLKSKYASVRIKAFGALLEIGEPAHSLLQLKGRLVLMNELVELEHSSDIRAEAAMLLEKIDESVPPLQ